MLPVGLSKLLLTLNAEDNMRAKIILAAILISSVFISCSKEGTDAINSKGKGGSMARFTVCGDYLYSVDNTSLKVFDIATPTATTLVNTVNIGFGIETIFPFNNYLFIGSQDGMYIYDISNPSVPSYIAKSEHILSCDPVVANDSLAFVTLRSGSLCRNTNVNRLDILDIKNISDPVLIRSHFMTSPFGLGLDSTYLFVCNGTNGLDLYDVRNPYNIVLMNHIDGITTYDIILYNKTMFVIGETGFYQYDYSDINNITLLSQILKE